MSTLGTLAGHGILQVVKAITGFGDYRIQGNSLLEGSLPPVINTSGMNGFIVRHREYIGDITATTNFTPITYPINPGMITTFPWLSQIADSFEQYTLRGLIFEYKTMSSDALLSAGTGTALGTVIMATQYNALNPPFVDKRTMENYEFANSSKPSLTFYHPVECLRRLTTVSELYVRTGVPPTGSDIRLYDLGEFTIATQGMQVATGVIGELWCTFEVEFFKPKLIQSEGLEIGTDFYLISAPSGTVPLGTPTPGANNSLGTTITIGSSTNVVTFPLADTSTTYLVVYVVTGTSVTVVPPIVNHGNCTALLIWENNVASLVQTPSGTVTTAFFRIEAIQPLSANLQAQLIYQTAGTIPSAGVGNYIITQTNTVAIDQLFGRLRKYGINMEEQAPLYNFKTRPIDLEEGKLEPFHAEKWITQQYEDFEAIEEDQNHREFDEEEEFNNQDDEYRQLLRRLREIEIAKRNDF